MNKRLQSPTEIRYFIERVQLEAWNGELRFSSDAPLGTENPTSSSTARNAKLYLERGAVAWGFATGQRVSFQSILLTEFGFDQKKLVEGIHAARSAGKRSLDEMLTALGLNDAAKRSDIVVRHTRAALDTLESWDGCVVEFIPAEQAPASASLKDLPSTLKPILTRIPGCVVLSVVDLRSGTPLGVATRNGDFPADLAAAFFSELLRSSADTLIALGRATEEQFPVEELIVSARGELAILLPLRGGSFCLVALIEKSEGMPQARATLQRSAAVILKFLS